MSPTPPYIRESIVVRRGGVKHKILALIPARGGSKGIKHKNVVELCGKPLICYTIKSALDSALINRVVVSTDDKEIQKIAQGLGAEVPFVRPDNLSKDTTAMYDVLTHALGFLKSEQNYQPDIVVLLQPTSPLRTATHIDEALTRFIRLKADSVVSLCPVDYSPYWMKIIRKGLVVPFIEQGNRYTRRQDLPRVYQLNGAIYITKPEVIFGKQRQILGRKTYPYFMSKQDSVDIDTYEDILLAEALLRNRNIDVHR